MALESVVHISCRCCEIPLIKEAMAQGRRVARRAHIAWAHGAGTTLLQFVMIGAHTVVGVVFTKGVTVMED